MNESSHPPESSLSPRDRLASGAEQLDRVATLIAWGLPALGLLSATVWLLDRLDQPGNRPPGIIAALLGAAFLIGAYAVAGLVLAVLLRVLGAWLIASAERPATMTVAGPSTSALDRLREQAAAEFRHEVRSGKWADAAALLDAFRRDHDGDHRIAAMDQELASARAAARADVTARLDAARQVSDADRVLELHQALRPLLEADARQALETDLAKWFLRLIHNRLRSGIIQVDLATLAGRVADDFGHTMEGASLRASLPTLRRSAGLCPRCAQPYTGIADACPDCLRPAQPEVEAPAV
jgi:hypothetical protein